MLEVNGRTYALPRQPTVVVCMDGCEPDYLAQATFGGHMPWMKRTLAEGTGLVADCVVPTFTNPNNLKDPWGHPYIVVVPPTVNRDFDVVSFGADGQPGGEGEAKDIINGAK